MRLKDWMEWFGFDNNQLRIRNLLVKLQQLNLMRLDRVVSKADLVNYIVLLQQFRLMFDELQKNINSDIGSDDFTRDVFLYVSAVIVKPLRALKERHNRLRLMQSRGAFETFFDQAVAPLRVYLRQRDHGVKRTREVEYLIKELRLGQSLTNVSVLSPKVKTVSGRLREHLKSNTFPPSRMLCFRSGPTLNETFVKVQVSMGQISASLKEMVRHERSEIIESLSAIRLELIKMWAGCLEDNELIFEAIVKKNKWLDTVNVWKIMKELFAEERSQPVSARLMNSEQGLNLKNVKLSELVPNRYDLESLQVEGLRRFKLAVSQHNPELNQDFLALIYVGTVIFMECYVEINRHMKSFAQSREELNVTQRGVIQTKLSKCTKALGNISYALKEMFLEMQYVDANITLPDEVFCQLQRLDQARLSLSQMFPSSTGVTVQDQVFKNEQLPVERGLVSSV